MRKSTQKWANKKYGKTKTFICKRHPIKAYCFHAMIFETNLMEPKETDFYESIQDAKKDGWVKA